MIPRALIQHRLPGRLRLKVPERKGDHQWMAAAADALAGLEAVTGVRVNALTAGILIEHRSDTPDELLEQIRDKGLFEVTATRDGTAHAAGAEGAEADDLIPELHVQPHHLAGVAFLVLAVRQVLAGNILAPATNLAYHAFELLSRDSRGP